MTSRLLDAMAARPLLMDAAMGTRLIALGLDLRSDDPSAWVLTRPDDVLAIHRRDVEAGAEVVLTDTFGANRPRLERVGRSADVAAINARAVALAREAAGLGRFVLGSIGPTAGSYRVQADVLAESGVDGLILETHDPAGALLGLGELRRAIGLPILVGLYRIDDPAADLGRRIVEAGADAIGLNCLSPDRALGLARAIGPTAAAPLLARPSAAAPGHPSVTPEELAAILGSLLDTGVRLVGGCCGSTEAHVAALRSALDREASRLV